MCVGPSLHRWGCLPHLHCSPSTCEERSSTLFSARTSAATLRCDTPLRHSSIARQQRAMGVRMSLCLHRWGCHAHLHWCSIDQQRTFFHSLFGLHLRCHNPLRCTLDTRHLLPKNALHRWGCLLHLHWCSVDSRRTFFHSLFGSHLRCDTPMQCSTATLRCDTPM